MVMISLKLDFFWELLGAQAKAYQMSRSFDNQVISFYSAILELENLSFWNLQLKSYHTASTSTLLQLQQAD
jgi:hypothetical protein